MYTLLGQEFLLYSNERTYLSESRPGSCDAGGCRPRSSCLSLATRSSLDASDPAPVAAGRTPRGNSGCRPPMQLPQHREAAHRDQDVRIGFGNTLQRTGATKLTSCCCFEDVPRNFASCRSADVQKSADVLLGWSSNCTLHKKRFQSNRRTNRSEQCGRKQLEGMQVATSRVGNAAAKILTSSSKIRLLTRENRAVQTAIGQWLRA